MTLGDLMRALVRRWPVVLIGLLATVTVAGLSTLSDPKYHARTEMVFLAPSSVRYPNELVTRTESLIVTAGIVAKLINGPDERLKFGHSLVNPVGAPGDDEDTWIQLLDIGTQWVPVFDDQILLVDSVGDTPEQARERIYEAADEVQDVLLEIQQDSDADESTYIVARMSPEAPVVNRVGPSRMRSIAMWLAVGGFLTVSAVVVIEVRSRRTEAWNGLGYSRFRVGERS